MLTKSASDLTVIGQTLLRDLYQVLTATTQPLLRRINFTCDIRLPAVPPHSLSTLVDFCSYRGRFSWQSLFTHGQTSQDLDASLYVPRVGSPPDVLVSLGGPPDQPPYVRFEPYPPRIPSPFASQKAKCTRQYVACRISDGADGATSGLQRLPEVKKRRVSQ